MITKDPLLILLKHNLSETKYWAVSFMYHYVHDDISQNKDYKINIVKIISLKFVFEMLPALAFIPETGVIKSYKH